MGRIFSEHWLSADLTRVFSFFSDPRNLPRLMPVEMSVVLVGLELRRPEGRVLEKVVQSGIEPSFVAGPGSLIEISFRLVPFLPFRASWVAEILELEPLSYFLDQQRSGPMRRWLHRHSFRAEVRAGISGTVVRDEVEYELPFGPLGHFIDRVGVERMMQHTFRSRQQALERLLVG